MCKIWFSAPLALFSISLYNTHLAFISTYFSQNKPLICYSKTRTYTRNRLFPGCANIFRTEFISSFFFVWSFFSSSFSFNAFAIVKIEIPIFSQNKKFELFRSHQFLWHLCFSVFLERTIFPFRFFPWHWRKTISLIMWTMIMMMFFNVLSFWGVAVVIIRKETRK